MDKPQLFFLHYGGGNCYSFRFLYPYLERFEIIALELPGRGNRMTEPLIKNFEEAVTDYYSQIIKQIRSTDIIIYGHSMGAMLGWRVAKRLEENNIFPALLILSGNAGPGNMDKKGRYKLPQNEFVKELKRLGGIPEDILMNKELFDFFEPVLRADFEVLEKEAIVFNSVIKAPLIALMGSEEEKVNLINDWQKYCAGPFYSKVLEGNHFFINKYPRELAELIHSSYDNVSAGIKS